MLSAASCTEPRKLVGYYSPANQEPTVPLNPRREALNDPPTLDGPCLVHKQRAPDCSEGLRCHNGPSMKFVGLCFNAVLAVSYLLLAACGGDSTEAISPSREVRIAAAAVR